MKRLLAAVSLVALVSLVAGACGDTIRPPAATVNGSRVSQASLDLELKAIVGNPSYLRSIEQQGTTVRGTGRGTLDTGFVARVLTRQILLLLVHDELQRRRVTVEAADRTAAQQDVVQSVGGTAVLGRFPKSYQDILVLRNAEVLRLERTLSRSEITDAAVKAYYDEHITEFTSTCVSHILFAATDPSGQPNSTLTAQQIDQLKAQATQVKGQIDGGADFTAMAKQYSKDPSNAQQGGDLQCGPPGRFVPEFEDAMAKLQPGQVSDPVQTQFGIHLIKVTRRSPAPLSQVAGEIRQRILDQNDAQVKLTDFLQKAVAKGKISVNPRYGHFAKSGAAPGVVPPEAPTTTTVPIPGATTTTTPQFGTPPVGPSP